MSARPASGERKLWLAVLGEQVVLACRDKDPMKLRTHGDPAAARRWLGSRDFHRVCEFAGVSSEWVLRRVTAELARPQADRHLERIALRHVSTGMNIVREVA